MAFDESDDRWIADLEEALEYLPAKRKQMNRYERYHEGRHPKVWMSKRLRKQFRGMEDHMIDNLCGPAIDKPLARLRVDGFVTENEAVVDGKKTVTEEAEEKANQLFDELGLKYSQVDLERHALMFGEGYLYDALEEDEETGEEYETSTVVDPRYLYWPCGQNPMRPRVAVLMIPDHEDGVWRANVIYRDVVYRVKGPAISDVKTYPTNVKDFKLDDEDPGGEHGFDRLPVTRFSDRPYSDPVSRLAILIPGQDRINKLTGNKMVTSEGLAYPQRVLFTEQEVTAEQVEPKPDSTMVFDPGASGNGRVASSIQQFQAADMKNYTDPIHEEKKAFFILASLPLHGLNGDPSASGTAREADEGDFIEYLLGFQDFMNCGWDYWLSLRGLQAKTAWRDVRPRGDAQRINNVKLAVEAGVTIRAALKEYGGWSDEMIDAMSAEPMTKEQEMAATVALAQARALGGLGQTDGDN